MSGPQAVTVVTISGAFVIGVVLALLGSIKLALARQLHLGEGRIAGLLAALNLVLIPMMLLTGVLIDHLGIRVVLLLGSLVTSCALFSMSLAPNYQRAFGAVLLAGLGLAGMSTSVVVLMPHAFFMSPDRNIPAEMNLGFVFIALGALLTPILAEMLLRVLDYRRTVLLLSLFCLAPAFLCFLPAFRDEVKEFSNHASTVALTPWEGLGASHILLAGLVFLFYAPLEGAVGVWTTTFLTQAGHSERRAALGLSGFWGALLASRVLVALWQPRAGWDLWVLIVTPALLSAVVLGNLAGTSGKGSSRNGLLLLGFLLGPIFPTLVGVLFREFEAERGLVYGLMFAIGSLGSLLAAPLIGLRVDPSSAQRALRLTTVLAVFLALAALVFGLVVGAGR